MCHQFFMNALRNSSPASSAFFSLSPSQSNIDLPIHCHVIASSLDLSPLMAAGDAMENGMESECLSDARALSFLNVGTDRIAIVDKRLRLHERLLVSLRIPSAREERIDLSI